MKQLFHFEAKQTIIYLSVIRADSGMISIAMLEINIRMQVVGETRTTAEQEHDSDELGQAPEGRHFGSPDESGR